MDKTGLFELHAVVAVATQRSFRRAAEELGLSPSALSRAIGALEARMGVRLFNRTTRSVAPSEAGERFLDRVRPALAEIAQAMDAVNEFRDTPTGTLRLNAAEGAAQMLMAPVIAEYLRRHPAMAVEVVAESRLVDIVAEGFDAGVRAQSLVPQDMVAVPCSGPIRVAVVGAPAYFAAHGRPRTPADLARHACIRPRLPGGRPYRWELARRGRTLAFEPRGPLVLDNHVLMVEAAIAGIGLAWLNDRAVAHPVAAGLLEPVLADWTPADPAHRLCLYYPRHRHAAAGLRAFVALLRELWPAPGPTTMARPAAGPRPAPRVAAKKRAGRSA